MPGRRGNLSPAHKGYRYQDIATAYILVRAIVDEYDSIIVDRKQVEDDRIDDLEVVRGGTRVRRQFKSSQNEQRALLEDDFIANSSSLRIDRLVLTHIRSSASQPDEYRLCATWSPPPAEDPLADLIEPVLAAPTVKGWQSEFYRLRADLIWPEDGNPIWTPLLGGQGQNAALTRAELLTFCSRFVIELRLPSSSETLTTPGPLERALTDELAEGVGIGVYPNQGRAPSDVAALAIDLANLARTQEAELTPKDVLRELDIRTDFGRVAQAFPLDISLFHDRPTIRGALRKAALEGRHQLVTAPPGSGKSWELTQLAEELRLQGAIVARHYCYLEPGDELVERRVTTGVFFGNLLAELVESANELQGAGKSRYAASLPQLEATLSKAVSLLDRPIVLVVDGLDHIARVRQDAHSLADEDTDIVEQLATINLPPGVALVIGSQPGQHLEALHARWGEALVGRELPPWSREDLLALFGLHRVPQALTTVGVVEADEQYQIQQNLAAGADGNPLYARYLAKSLVAGIQDGSIGDPRDWVAEVPRIDGDLAVYYRHLYHSATQQAQAIADIIGVIDFAVTEGDLRQMLQPVFAQWVPAAVAHLSPILTSTSSQGGLRVFHESFRRFMIDELARQQRSVAHAIAPVVDWLTSRGFYRDAKAYRFLLPALRRAGRTEEVLALVNTSFVSDSVAQAHPLDAIQRNLSLAANTAASARDWPALVRCIELHRAAHTCFDDAQNDWHDYWSAYLELFGPSALSERLLFDGRPTWDRSIGLYACSIVDDAGGVAPWREYLELPTESGQESQDSFDVQGDLSANERDSLCVVHGMLRTGKQYRVISWLVGYLRESGDRIKPLFVRNLAARLARMTAPELVERIAQRSKPTRRGGPRVAPVGATALLLGAADEYRRVGNQDGAKRVATLALEGATTPELAMECVHHGAPPDSARPVAREPSATPIALGPGEFLHSADGLRTWVASLRLIASDNDQGPSILDRERQRVAGEGWYRCWLRFAIRLAEAEAAQYRGAASDVAGAFEELTRDTHPFRGKPRACDLYAIRRVISESVAIALSLLKDEQEWSAAVGFLATAAEETSSRLDREDGGPIPTTTLLDLLLPHAADTVAGPSTRGLIETLVARYDEIGTYYPTHAGLYMRLARSRCGAGPNEQTQHAWKIGAAFMSGYGWRKDITIFDIIETIPVIAKRSRTEGLHALVKAQRLADAVVAHTDGRSTNRAPNAWLRSLLAVHPVAGVAVLASTIRADQGSGGWPNAQGIKDVAMSVRENGNPALIDAVLATLPFHVEYEGAGAEDTDERLAPLKRMKNDTASPLARFLRNVAADIGEDSSSYKKEAISRLEEVAEEVGVPIPHAPLEATDVSQSVTQNRPATVERSERSLFRVPAFVPNASIVDLMSGLRTADRWNRWDDPEAWDSVVLALSYHAECLIDRGEEDSVARLLRFFARDIAVAGSEKTHPLGLLAEALEGAGHTRLAALAYTLAYAATRGGMGYLRLGSASHKDLLARGLALDAELAMQVLADEVAYGLRGSWYSAGTTKHLVARIADWGDVATAIAAWSQAFEVVAMRLPLPPSHGWFTALVLEQIPDWTVDESLVSLLLARLSNPILARKKAALAGLVRAITFMPEAVAKPLDWWLRQDVPVTSVLLALDALCNAEPEPFAITQALEETLVSYLQAPIWGASSLSRLLLERAGLAVPSGSGPVELQPPSASRPTEQQRTALLSADVGKTLDRLAGLWPDLPDLVVHRLHSILDGQQAQIDRAIQRYRLFRGRDGKAYPATPVLLWETEVFEFVLHGELCGLRAHLWRTGQFDPEMEESVLGTVLPHTALHLGLYASRSVRPGWPSPSTLFEGVGVLPTVGDDDPDYKDWIRVATVEREYVGDSDHPYSRPVEVVTLLAGAVAPSLGGSVPTRAFPFQNGDIDNWWNPHAEPMPFPPRLPLGTIINLARTEDWLGDSFVLIPPPLLQSYLGLSTPSYGEPLVWKDSNNVGAIALRTWRVLSSSSFEGEPVRFEGSDLLIRPDVFARLSSLYATALRELRVVWRRSVSSATED